MIKVYIASKLGYAEQFRGYRDQWKDDGIDLHARWFDQAHIEQNGEPTPEEFKVFWWVDEADVKCSQALILYGEKNDTLRGALVEAGIAIATRIPIFLVGDCDFGTWRNHALVTNAVTFEHAKTLIKRLYR